MTTKNFKTTKLALAILSSLFFFIFVLPDFNFMGIYDSYFSLGLIVVLILAITNYFFKDEKYNIAVNILALFMVASFGYKLFEEVFLYYNFPFTFLLLPIILAPIFMVDNFKIKEIKKSLLTIKKLHFQLTIIVCVYILYLLMLGHEIATILFIVLLLCAFYIICEQKQHKSARWLRTIIFSILAYKLFYFIAVLPMTDHVLKLWNPDISNLKLIRQIYYDSFWSILTIGIMTFTLLFNKPTQQGTSWFKKLFSKFR